MWPIGPVLKHFKVPNYYDLDYRWRDRFRENIFQTYATLTNFYLILTLMVFLADWIIHNQYFTPNLILLYEYSYKAGDNLYT